MLFLGKHGYRVIAHDRRGHGHSTQSWSGNDINTYAADLNAVINHLNLKNIITVGHSTGGGEVTRFLGTYGTSKVAKAVLIGSITPSLGIPLSVWDTFRTNYITNRPQLFLDFASGPFFGFDRPRANVSQGLIQEFMEQGFKAGFVNLYDCITAFSETDFTADMKKLNIPVLILHGDADEVVPIDNTARKAIQILKHGALKIYPGGAHALPQTNANQVNQDLLDFIQK
ncbi:alpha/beta hydrolase protein [Calycina marina]|uniref:Alpha/beta hydrolase protein n=1 Tax=Calycina marina TaxID=1763456 RepID=A0A9P7Z359_9HELO|nr:alpha/beta hydrolase protein [Calycina marina]